MDRNDKQLFIQAIEKWGVKAQVGMVIEECAELIQAINKYDRKGNDDNERNLIGEMVDVSIMIEQLKEILYCYDRFEIIYKEKIKKLANILKEEDLNGRETD